MQKKCFAKIYTQPVLFHGALMCWGGFGQPQCKHLKQCLEQYQEDIPKRKFNNLIKRIEQTN